MGDCKAKNLSPLLHCPVWADPGLQCVSAAAKETRTRCLIDLALGQQISRGTAAVPLCPVRMSSLDLQAPAMISVAGDSVAAHHPILRLGRRTAGPAAAPAPAASPPPPHWRRASAPAWPPPSPAPRSSTISDRRSWRRWQPANIHHKRSPTNTSS